MPNKQHAESKRQVDHSDGLTRREALRKISLTVGATSIGLLTIGGLKDAFAEQVQTRANFQEKTLDMPGLFQCTLAICPANPPLTHQAISPDSNVEVRVVVHGPDSVPAVGIPIAIGSAIIHTGMDGIAHISGRLGEFVGAATQSKVGSSISNHYAIEDANWISRFSVRSSSQLCIVPLFSDPEMLQASNISGKQYRAMRIRTAGKDLHTVVMGYTVYENA